MTTLALTGGVVAGSETGVHLDHVQPSEPASGCNDDEAHAGALDDGRTGNAFENEVSFSI